MLDAVLAGRPFPRRSLELLVQGIGVGLVTALVLIALDVMLFAPRLAAAHLTEATAAPRLWTGALYALSGRISEEVVFHYGLLSVTPLVAACTIVVGAIGGVVTGWLYWRRGLETAMIAHGVVSSALHVVAVGAFG